MADESAERQSIQSIGAQMDTLEARESDAARKRRLPRLPWVVDAVLPIALIISAGVAVMLPPSLSVQARWSLWSFALAVILWSTTKLNAAYVALTAVLVLVITRGAPQDLLFNALASDVVWLIIGAFVLGGAVQETGLANRLTGAVVERTRTVRGAFWLLTTALIPLSFFIPSTSGRAAVALPVFRGISEAAGDSRITRALALLMPTVILTATNSALIAAGSHLIANDLLYQTTGQRISFTRWMVYGAPFGAAASYISCWTVLWLFLDRERRRRELTVSTSAKRNPLSMAEWKTLAVAVALALDRSGAEAVMKPVFCPVPSITG